MANLTAKQQKFVDGLVAGLSQRQAFIQAGYSTKGKTDNYIDKEASLLFKNSKVSVRYNELMDEHKEKALWTREEAVSELIWLYKQSKKSIELQDDGYVRQGTSGAMLGALDRLIALELLDPIAQLEYEKLKKELEPDLEQEDKIVKFAKLLDEVYSDE